MVSVPSFLPCWLDKKYENDMESQEALEGIVSSVAAVQYAPYVRCQNKSTIIDHIKLYFIFFAYVLFQALLFVVARVSRDLISLFDVSGATI